ncbi:MAG TPA: hypothetical protein VFJ30_15900 [Phycisphaerae bacterium]|nr:hypothetical protein [Phycisphaerae bacterium]
MSKGTVGAMIGLAAVVAVSAFLVAMLAPGPGAQGAAPAAPTTQPAVPKAPLKEKWMRGQTGAGGTEYGRVIPEGPSEEAADQPWPPATYGPEAEREFAVKREAVFAFVGKPAVSGRDGAVVITFESRGRCDATVAIEDKDGRIVRHLASGLLGANAPAPFQKDSLRQRLAWDGKDDFGEPVAGLAGCTVRVSLGLKARYERSFYDHPDRKRGFQTAVAIDADGVYLYENNLVDSIRQFDHDGTYVRTLYPFAADKIQDIQGVPWQPVPPDGRKVPAKRGAFNNTLLPLTRSQFATFGDRPIVGAMVAAGGRLVLLGDPRTVYLGTDGTTRGFGLVGPTNLIDTGALGKYSKKPVLQPARRAAASPDGKWIYLTRVFFEKGAEAAGPTRVWNHAVFRLAPGGEKAEPFLGAREPGNDASHFNQPASVAVDAKGRIYVADYGNDRVQVHDPDGKFLQGFPVSRPAEVRVDRNNGEIYVFCWDIEPTFRNESRSEKAWLRRFPPLHAAGDRPAGPLLEAQIAFDRQPPGLFTGNLAQAELDCYGKEPVIWLLPAEPNLFRSTPSRYNGPLLCVVKDGRLALKKSFDAACRSAGSPQKCPFFQRQQLYFDPVRQKLYVAELQAGHVTGFRDLVVIDVGTGDLKSFRAPFGFDDMAFDARGLAYLRAGDWASNAVVRFDPATWKEEPFENGREGKAHRGEARTGVAFQGGVCLPGGTQRCPVLGVSPRGEMLLPCSRVTGIHSHYPDTSAVPLGEGAWTPQYYAGRQSFIFMHLADAAGQVKAIDVLKGVGWLNGGIDVDMQGNAYVALRDRRVLDGKPFGKIMWGNGALVKIRAKDLPASRVLTAENGLVPDQYLLTDKPARPQDAEARWIEGVQWVYGSAPVGEQWGCCCKSGRFKVDYFGRSFVPEAWRYDVAVLDTNGNLILTIGRYGNADSAGPKSPVPLGGDGIGLFDAHFVTTDTDRRLFIADVGNGRIVSAKLDYHVTERLPLAAESLPGVR